jgi:replicative superfamily II helicase
MFPWQVECLTHREEVTREKANLIYSAPTSAGKTLVSELIMLRNIIREPAKKALIVMPYVSLITEKEMKLKKLL